MLGAEPGAVRRAVRRAVEPMRRHVWVPLRVAQKESKLVHNVLLAGLAPLNGFVPEGTGLEIADGVPWPLDKLPHDIDVLL